MTDEERIKEKLIGAKLTAEGREGEEPVHVHFTGDLEALLNLAGYALADVTAEVIKTNNWTENEAKRAIFYVQDKVAELTLEMLAGRI
jgi:hypothetical protein